MRLKIFFLIILFGLCSIQSVQAHQTLWESPTLEPAEDDPWKHRLFTELPENFLKDLQKRNEKQFSTFEEFQDATQMIDCQRQAREDLALTRMGNFIYNPRLIVGSGEEGAIYLAQHIPTGIYAAVKKTKRESEYTAFKDLGRCYACFSETTNKYANYFIFRPLIIGTQISMAEYDLRSELGIEINEKNEVCYKNWPYNLKLIDAYIAEVERGLKYKAVPQELDSNSMFVVDEATESPHIVFVDLISGQYRQNSPDLVCNQLIWAVMFRFIGHKPTTDMDNLVFPAPIQKFLQDACKEVNKYYVSLENLKGARNQLMEEMKALGFPVLPKI